MSPYRLVWQSFDAFSKTRPKHSPSDTRRFREGSPKRATLGLSNSTEGPLRGFRGVDHYWRYRLLNGRCRRFSKMCDAETCAGTFFSIFAGKKRSWNFGIVGKLTSFLLLSANGFTKLPPRPPSSCQMSAAIFSTRVAHKMAEMFFCLWQIRNADYASALDVTWMKYGRSLDLYIFF